MTGMHVPLLEAALATAYRRDEELVHWTRRMLQALDAYWEHCEGLSNAKARTVRSQSTAEDWWHRYEKYRARVEALC